MITSLIVAAAANDVIGADGALPWYLPDDLRRFRRLTTGHAVVAGRVTHESIVARLGRPLPGRTCVVVSGSAPADDAASVPATHAKRGSLALATPAAAGNGVVLWAASVPAALRAARAASAGTGEVFVIGGASVYQQALPEVDRVYLTRLHREVPGDCRMPDGWLDGFTLAGREDHDGFSYLEYRRPAPWPPGSGGTPAERPGGGPAVEEAR